MTVGIVLTAWALDAFLIPNKLAAGGAKLETTVVPFLLRGVNILGIDSVMCPIELRKAAWTRLASDLDPSKLIEITQEIGLGEVIAAGAKILAGQVRGRIVVNIS